MTRQRELDTPLDTDDTMAALDAAVRTPDADEVEIAVLARAGGYTRFAGAVIHQPQDITEVQYLVRAVVNGHPFRTATTAAHRLPGAVFEAARSARARARSAKAAGRVQVAGIQPDESPGQLWFDDAADFDAAARVAAARNAAAAADAAGGDAAGMFGRAVTQQLVATSRGVRRATVATEASGALTVTAADGTAHWVDLSRSAQRLNLTESVAAAVAYAVASKGRVALPPGTYPVVLGAEAVGELLQFLPELGFSGQLAAAGVGLAATRAGEQVIGAGLDIADDATADVGLPIGFDIEGVTKRRVPFFAGGRVGEPVTDLATAAVLGGVSSGHAHIAREQVPEPEAANIVLAAGDVSEADLIAGVENGVYIQRFWYTRVVDRTAGTITGVTRDACFVIDNGRLTTPIEGMRFTESVISCLAGVMGIGRETRSQSTMNIWNGAVSAPPLRARAFRLGAAPID
jgi:predicted Zn-dependent protease